MASQESIRKYGTVYKYGYANDHDNIVEHWRRMPADLRENKWEDKEYMISQPSMYHSEASAYPIGHRTTYHNPTPEHNPRDPKNNPRLRYQMMHDGVGVVKSSSLGRDTAAPKVVTKKTEEAVRVNPGLGGEKEGDTEDEWVNVDLGEEIEVMEMDIKGSEEMAARDIKKNEDETWEYWVMS
ncbi:hypothetical protein EG329_002194 [Mollisiaceae sp. DMI_Dod_QoI]|nr:hypothetical protein EG329_002194 [Helotiales sp. DMI_Dod_QoI]